MSSPPAQLTLESRRSSSHHRKPSLNPTIKTPLLMPPPATLMSRFKHGVYLRNHQITSWVISNKQSLLLFLRLSIFVLKMVSITKPCVPAATKQLFLYPLMFLAAVELALGFHYLGAMISWQFVSTFAVAHVFILVWARQWGGGLCERMISLA
jgi:hypothetical protein